ncbi:PREDICTED: putative bifunctional UDP-N-acetylglucosamine transferase and deubiquitinase ALG13 isoform X2 [Chinchilla lanigera]|uniref:putative bifunctional UDP-N-acetylglucosamine transferase and deubiquitinase ALG13 isoform X2 n=1 Tax=Chinchilla lanigera TaxID=34839 RepID=UPI000697A640|nr:PREDICTED: putative bifunctional UDP-N-acetylglucosamine transferase and deubiquitinase ALG13 isoform X2 [Chinchilla lanigera]
MGPKGAGAKAAGAKAAGAKAAGPKPEGPTPEGPSAPPAPEAAPPPDAPPAPPAPEQTPTQTQEELDFYAPSYVCLTFTAIILFPPLGMLGLYFSRQGFWKPIPMLPSLQTTEANEKSDWEQAYANSARTGWLDVCAILIGLGLIYGLVLYS